MIILYSQRTLRLYSAPLRSAVSLPRLSILKLPWVPRSARTKVIIGSNRTFVVYSYSIAIPSSTHICEIAGRTAATVCRSFVTVLSMTDCPECGAVNASPAPDGVTVSPAPPPFRVCDPLCSVVRISESTAYISRICCIYTNASATAIAHLTGTYSNHACTRYWPTH